MKRLLLVCLMLVPQLWTAEGVEEKPLTERLKMNIAAQAGIGAATKAKGIVDQTREKYQEIGRVAERTRKLGGNLFGLFSPRAISTMRMLEGDPANPETGYSDADLKGLLEVVQALQGEQFLETVIPLHNKAMGQEKLFIEMKQFAPTIAGIRNALEKLFVVMGQLRNRAKSEDQVRKELGVLLKDIQKLNAQQRGTFLTPIVNEIKRTFKNFCTTVETLISWPLRRIGMPDPSAVLAIKEVKDGARKYLGDMQGFVSEVGRKKSFDGDFFNLLMKNIRFFVQRAIDMNNEKMATKKISEDLEILLRGLVARAAEFGEGFQELMDTRKSDSSDSILSAIDAVDKPLAEIRKKALERTSQQSIRENPVLNELFAFIKGVVDSLQTMLKNFKEQVAFTERERLQGMQLVPYRPSEAEKLGEFERKRTEDRARALELERQEAARRREAARRELQETIQRQRERQEEEERLAQEEAEAILEREGEKQRGSADEARLKEAQRKRVEELLERQRQEDRTRAEQQKQQRAVNARNDIVRVVKRELNKVIQPRTLVAKYKWQLYKELEAFINTLPVDEVLGVDTTNAREVLKFIESRLEAVTWSSDLIGRTARSVFNQALARLR